jgi:hypothetical protein
MVWTWGTTRRCADHARHRRDHATGRGLRRTPADPGRTLGLGDLVLTCTGSLSRNRMVGIELGKGRKLAEILEEMNGKVAEGV